MQYIIWLLSDIRNDVCDQKGVISKVLQRNNDLTFYDKGEQSLFVLDNG